MHIALRSKKREKVILHKRYMAKQLQKSGYIYISEFFTAFTKASSTVHRRNTCHYRLCKALHSRLFSVCSFFPKSQSAFREPYRIPTLRFAKNQRTCAAPFFEKPTVLPVKILLQRRFIVIKCSRKRRMI